MEVAKDLVAASATPLVLSLLSRGESYGYEIIKQIKDLSGGEINWSDGMLYPVLHRLERQDLVKARWAKADSGRKRKYYRLTAKGKKSIGREQKQWRVVVSALEKLWEPKACST